MSSEPDTHDSLKSTEVFQRLGSITRQLHESLNELGYTPVLKGAVDELPDARSRLKYIARLTGEAAEKVLNRVDEAKAEQERVIEHTEQLLQTIRGVPGLKWAMPELLEWTEKIQQDAQRTDQHLTDIMMAQDFHDLTGQVINRVVTLAATIESQLLQLLVQAAPQPPTVPLPASVEAAPEILPLPPMPTIAPSHSHAPVGTPEHSALAGPVVDPEGRTDVVSNQSEVDDLLASLGF